MDIVLSNIKNYKDIAEKRSIYYDEVEKALEIVQTFIKDNKFIIYGGLAIDIALKITGHPGIYLDDVIPDFDIYSSDFYNDSNKLAVILHQNNMKNVSAINAVHLNSRRVRVNFTPVCDFSYLPKNVLDNIPYIEIKSNQNNIKKYNGMRIVHPDFQRLDLHRSFTIPYSNPPQEVILHRLEKDSKRFVMLNERYKMDTFNLKLSGKTKNIEILPGDVVYTGLVYYSIILSMVKADALPIKFNDNMSIDIPVELMDIPLTIIANDPDNFILQNSLNRKNAVYHNKYLDNIRPKSVVIDNYEIFYNVEQLPYYNFKNIKIASGNGLLLFFLQKYFETNDNRYKLLYNSTINIIQAAEKLVLTNADMYEKLPCFLPPDFYGEVKHIETPRPPFGFYPAKSLEWPEFNVNEND